MDVNKIREDFPLLKNRDIIYHGKSGLKGLSMTY